MDHYNGAYKKLCFQTTSLKEKCAIQYGFHQSPKCVNSSGNADSPLEINFRKNLFHRHLNKIREQLIDFVKATYMLFMH